MKIKLYLHKGDAHLTLHRHKSKKKSKSRVNTQFFSPKSQLSSDEVSNRSRLLSKWNQNIEKKERSLSKRPCSHKKKDLSSSQITNEYYKCQHRDLEDLKKQNDQLVKENKILNEYFRYFENKYDLKEKKKSEKVFSFRNIGVFGTNTFQSTQESKQGIFETKNSSKFKGYGM